MTHNAWCLIHPVVFVVSQLKLFLDCVMHSKWHKVTRIPSCSLKTMDFLVCCTKPYIFMCILVFVYTNSTLFKLTFRSDFVD